MNNSEENVHKSENFTESSGIQRVMSNDLFGLRMLHLFSVPACMFAESTAQSVYVFMYRGWNFFIDTMIHLYIQ